MSSRKSKAYMNRCTIPLLTVAAKPKIGLLLSVLVTVGATGLGGCTTTTTNYYASSNDALLAVGEKEPDGYPRSYISREKLGCVETTESWKKEPALFGGQVAWLKHIDRRAIACK